MQDEMQPAKQIWTNGNSWSCNKLPLSAHAAILTNPVTHSLTAHRRCAMRQQFHTHISVLTASNYNMVLVSGKARSLWSWHFR